MTIPLYPDALALLAGALILVLAVLILCWPGRRDDQ